MAVVDERTELFNEVSASFNRDPGGTVTSQKFYDLAKVMNMSLQNLSDHMHKIRTSWLGDHVRIADARRRRDPSDVNEAAYEIVARMHYNGDPMPKIDAHNMAVALVEKDLAFKTQRIISLTYRVTVDVVGGEVITREGKRLGKLEEFAKTIATDPRNNIHMVTWDYEAILTSAQIVNDLVDNANQ